MLENNNEDVVVEAEESVEAILENVFGESLEVSPNLNLPGVEKIEKTAKPKKKNVTKKFKKAKPVAIKAKPVVVKSASSATEELGDEPVVEQTNEPVVEQSNEPVVEKSNEPSVEKRNEPSVEKKNEPSVEQTVEAEGEKGISFADLPLSPEVQKAVELTGYKHPTPIQAEIIPHLLFGTDVLAQSQTGTGKTAAFALPILTRIETECKEPQVLVLVPTRELAIQVAKSFATYGSQLPGFQHAVIYGGQDYEIQYRQLRKGPQVIVGTPGRTIDHIKNGKLDISKIGCLVLDEADEMLNMGFLDDVKFVLDRAPDDRQIALFSATLPEPIRRISERYLTNPAKVTIKQKTLTADSIRQRAVFVSPRDRVDMLVRFLEAEDADGAIVFTRTRETTSVVAEKLTRAGLRAFALNGEMPQKARERTIEKLKSGQLDILVATDIAARGLDVSRISHVFNYDLPEGPEAYTHRVGRTGRAGKKGEAIIFVTHSQRGKLRFIEKITRQEIEIVDPPTADQINKMRIKRFYSTIDKTIAERDMNFFDKLVSDYVEQSEHPVEKIAAAIAMISQNGRDFLMKDRPVRSEKRKGGRESNDGRGKSRFNGPPESGMARFRLAVGKQDGVRPGNIVGAITNEANIDGDDIGSIRIHHEFSTIDLPADRADEIIGALSETRVSGRAIKIRTYEERGDRRPSSGGDRRYSKRDSRPSGRRDRNEDSKSSKPKRRGNYAGNKSSSHSDGKSSNYAGSKSSSHSGGKSSNYAGSKSKSAGPAKKKGNYKKVVAKSK